MKPFEVDAQGYGTWAYRNRRVIITPVWNVHGSRFGYRYKIPGHFRLFSTGSGWSTLEKCQRAAAARINRLVGKEVSK